MSTQFSLSEWWDSLRCTFLLKVHFFTKLKNLEHISVSHRRIVLRIATKSISWRLQCQNDGWRITVSWSAVVIPEQVRWIVYFYWTLTDFKKTNSWWKITSFCQHLSIVTVIEWSTKVRFTSRSFRTDYLIVEACDAVSEHQKSSNCNHCHWAIWATPTYQAAHCTGFVWTLWIQNCRTLFSKRVTCVQIRTFDSNQAELKKWLDISQDIVKSFHWH